MHINVTKAGIGYGVGWLIYLAISMSINYLTRFPLLLIFTETVIFFLIWLSLSLFLEKYTKQFRCAYAIQFNFLYSFFFWLLVSAITALVWGPILVKVLFPAVSNDGHHMAGTDSLDSLLRYTWGRFTDIAYLFLNLSIIQFSRRLQAHKVDSHLSKKEFITYTLVVLFFIFVCRITNDTVYYLGLNYQLRQLVGVPVMVITVVIVSLLVNTIILGSRSYNVSKFYYLYTILIILLIPLSFALNIIVAQLADTSASLIGFVKNSPLLRLHENSKQEMVLILAGSSRQIFHYCSLFCGVMLLLQYWRSFTPNSTNNQNIPPFPSSKEFWINSFLSWFAFLFIAYIAEHWWYGDFSIVNLFVYYMWIILVAVLLTVVARFIILANTWYSDNLNILIPKLMIISLIMGVSLFVVESFIEIVLEFFSPGYFKNAIISSSEKIIFESKAFYFKLVLYVLLFFIWCFSYCSFLSYQNRMQMVIRHEKLSNENKTFELSLLKNQLDPHFIFNTLTGIRYLVSDSPEKARESLSKLSELLRENLKKMNVDKITIQQEMLLVNSYMALVQIQLDGKLEYIEEIASNTKQCYVPTMMVQMLVENSVKHGALKATTKSFICVSIKSFEKNISIDISNSIVTGAQKNLDGLGLGLNNLKKRILLMYGENSNFSFSIRENKAQCSIIIPRECIDESSGY